MTVEITTGKLPFDVIISCGKPEIIKVQPNAPVSIVIDMKRDGQDGITPVKGVDYFDGITPVKGVDYFDGVDGVTPVKGVDYFDGADGTTDIIITGADTGILADFTGSTINTIVKTFPTAENLFAQKKSFLMRFGVYKANGGGSCTIRVYFNTLESLTLGTPVLLSTSIIPTASQIANVSKNMLSNPLTPTAYSMLNGATSSFVDYGVFAGTMTISLSDQPGFLIVAFQLSTIGERALLSYFNLSTS